MKNSHLYISFNEFEADGNYFVDALNKGNVYEHNLTFEHNEILVNELFISQFSLCISPNILLGCLICKSTTVFFPALFFVLIKILERETQTPILSKKESGKTCGFICIGWKVYYFLLNFLLKCWR